MVFNFYEIRNKVNGKKYIGITEKQPEIRFKQHKNKLLKGCHINYKLQSDWNKYGEENFDFVVIESLSFDDINLGYEHEYELISSGENLYNLAPGGRINPMYSKEIREKMTITKQSKVPNIYQLKEIEENVFKIIGKFSSQKEAQRETGCSQANIQKSIKNNVKGSGYYWVEEDKLCSFTQEWKPKRIKITPTAELDSKGNIVKVHHNRSLFEKEYNWTTGSIKSAIQRKGKAHGIKFINISEEQYYKIKPVTLLF